jgi:hypothetical protein
MKKEEIIQFCIHLMNLESGWRAFPEEILNIDNIIYWKKVSAALNDLESTINMQISDFEDNNE